MDDYDCPKQKKIRILRVKDNGKSKVFAETPKRKCDPAEFYDLRWRNVKLGCEENILSFRRVKIDCKEEKFEGALDLPVCITNICVYESSY